jgi:hypothetical protein
MIFDCRSKDPPKKADFTEVGEDRKTSGIIFKSANAPIYMFGNDCYIGLSKDTGRITLDGKVGGELYFRGQKWRARTDEFEIIGPESKKLLQIMYGNLYLNTDVNWFTGFYYFKEGVRCSDLEVQGFVRCYGSVYAEQHFGSKYGGPVGKSPTIPKVYPTSQEIQKTVDDQYADVKAETEIDEQKVVKEADAPGNKEFQTRVHFSCRKTKQYFGGQQGTFFMWETRWQNLLKQGGGSTTWDEPEVPRTGGGTPEMPHPGIDAWKKQEKFKYVEDPNNYVAQTGVAKPRPSMKETGKPPKKKKLSEAYIIGTQT